MEHLPEGSNAPDFVLESISGEPFGLTAALADGALALVFFKSSCPTCQLTLPFIQSLYASCGPGTRIWGVSQDDRPETRRFAERYDLAFPILVDEHPYRVSDDYALKYVPTVYRIAADGRIQLADFGFSKPALRDLAAFFAGEAGIEPPHLFGDTDRLPERRPG
jgi:peroxiredoxin